MRTATAAATDRAIEAAEHRSALPIGPALDRVALEEHERHERRDRGTLRVPAEAPEE